MIWKNGQKKPNHTRKKDREGKHALKAKTEKLKVENINLKKQLNDPEVSREDGDISSIEDIKEEIKMVKEE